MAPWWSEITPSESSIGRTRGWMWHLLVVWSTGLGWDQFLTVCQLSEVGSSGALPPGLNGALNGPIVTIAALVLFSLVDLRVSGGPQGLWWTSVSLMDLKFQTLWLEQKSSSFAGAIPPCSGLLQGRWRPHSCKAACPGSERGHERGGKWDERAFDLMIHEHLRYLTGFGLLLKC